MLEQRICTKHHQAMIRQSGFSLLELAVVLAILGILFSGILVAVSATTENARRSETRAQLSNVMQALYGFAQANGRLPCPATDTSDGLESRLATGECGQYHGFVPIHTLGLAGSVNTDTLMLDAWGNPLRYSVAVFRDSASPPADDDFAFTRADGLRWLFENLSITPLVSHADLLSVCNNSTCGAGEIIADTVPAVVLSMGANWSEYTSANEIANAGTLVPGGYSLTNTNNFVSTEYSDEDFDDIVVWMSPYVLFTRLISAGRLP